MIKSIQINLGRGIGLFLCLFLLAGTSLWAQQTSLVPNRYTTLKPANGFANLTAVSSTSFGLDHFSNKNSVVDNDTTNFSSWPLLVTASMEVRDNNATGANAYPAGSFAGFVVNKFDVLSISSISLTAYNGDSQVGDPYTVPASQTTTVGLLSSSQMLIGFHPTGAFNRIRATFTGIGVGTISVYYAVVKKYQAGPTLPCNLNTQLASPSYPASINYAQTGVTGIALGDVSNIENIIDGNNNTSATLNITAGIEGRAQISVRDNITDHPIGTFVGFDIASTSLFNLGVLATVELRSYLNGSLQQTIQGANLIAGAGLLSGTGRSIVGFVTTTAVDEVQIVLKSGVVGVNLGTTQVYSAIFKRFCEVQTPPPCNTKAYLTSPNYPVTVDKANSGIIGIGLGDNLVNIDNIIDANIDNYATINQSLASLGANMQVSVKKVLTSFPGGYYAGFDIGQSSLLSADLLTNLSVATYLNGNLQETSANNSAAISLGSSVLTGNGRRLIGFKSAADKPFNEIRLIINSGINVAVLKQLHIYGAVVQEFCAGTALVCNTFTPMRTPAYPVYVDGRHTGYTGIASFAGSISNSENVVDGNPDNAATINLTLGVGSSTTFAVSDAVNIYNTVAGDRTYVGFEIATNSIANAGLLSAMKVRLVKPDGTLGTAVNTTLLAGATVLAGENRQYVGIVADEPFVGAQLVIEGAASLNVFGDLKIFGVAFQKLCSEPVACNQIVTLTNGVQPVVINNERTGPGGLANVNIGNSSISGAWNIIDGSAATYATMKTNIGVLNATSISVENPIDEYPVGSYAGFVVENAVSLLDAGLVSGLTIVTYNNGIEQERRAAASLLNAELLGLNIFGTGGGIRNVGFQTTKPFDEIRLIAGDIVSVNLNLAYDLRVYGAFVDTRSALIGGVLCSRVLPDVHVGHVNAALLGNVSTNDVVTGTVHYGSWTQATTSISTTAGSAASGSIQLNQNGIYSFTGAAPGVYTFDVPAYFSATTSSTARLVITIIDENVTNGSNPPIVNGDVVYVKGHATATSATLIDVKANDGKGNSEQELGNPVITAAPAHGTASIVNGQLSYTPAAGFYGVDRCTYSVTDAANQTGTAEVLIYIFAEDVVLPTAVAADDYFAFKISSVPVTVAAANGVLANDLSINNPAGLQVLTTSVTLPGSAGTITFQPNGGYTFTPGTGFLASATYEVIYSITSVGGTTALANGTLYILGYNIGVLPVSFVSFTATEKSCSTVELNWQTATEENFSHFDVEYSKDGSTYTKVATVAGKNNPGGSSYSTTVNQADKQGYYRLKAVDLDATFEYSSIAVTNLSCVTAAVTVAPNPTTGQFTVNGLTTGSIVKVVDINGREIYTTNVTGTTLVVDIAGNAAGIYLVQIINGHKGVETIKLVKQ